MASTLHLMKHHIRTGFGISLDTLQWDVHNNNEGLGQGNGGASVSWHSHMLALEREYQLETGQGVEYKTPDNTRQVFQWLVWFIDGNSIIIKLENLGYADAVSTLITSAKKCMEIWQRLVHITEGGLELHKSSFDIMTWKLNVGKETMCQIKDEPGSVSLWSEKYKGHDVKL